MSKRRTKPHVNRRPGPDDRLAAEQFADLNRQFYRAKLPPHEYLMHRYRGLFLAAQSPDVLPAGFTTELVIGELKGTWGDEGGWDDIAVRDFVSTESTVLLHHAAEALFRLYFAHADGPECPWLAVARLRLPSQFKERLNKFIRDADTDAVAASATNVFYGRSSVPSEREEQWSKVREGLMLLLKHLARRLVSEAPLYNSAKHGLSLVPGAASVQFGDPDGPFPIKADGPSITYLTVADRDAGKRWVQETVWLDPARTLAVVMLAIHQLSNLWHVACTRYSGEEWEESRIRYMSPSFVSQVLHPPLTEGVRVTVPSFSMDLLYYER